MKETLVKFFTFGDLLWTLKLIAPEEEFKLNVQVSPFFKPFIVKFPEV
jgi:hypothetical protein